MTGNILLGKFSPKHFIVSPEQQQRWLDWDGQLSRAISLEVTPPLAVKAGDTGRFLSLETTVLLYPMMNTVNKVMAKATFGLRTFLL